MTNLKHANGNESTRVYKEILERMRKLLNFTHLSKSLDDCSIISSEQKSKKRSKKKDLNFIPSEKKLSEKTETNFISTKKEPNISKHDIPLTEDILPFNASFMSLALTAKELQDAEEKVKQVQNNKFRTIHEKYKVLRSVFFKEKLSSLEFDNTNTCFSPICLTRNLNFNDNDSLLSMSSEDSELDADIKPHRNIFGQNTFTVMQVSNYPRKNSKKNDYENYEDKQYRSVSVNTKHMVYKQINNEKSQVFIDTSDTEYPYEPSANSLPFEVLEYDISEKKIVITERTNSKLIKQNKKAVKSSVNEMVDKLNNKKQKSDKYLYEPSLTSLPPEAIETKPLLNTIIPSKTLKNTEIQNEGSEEDNEIFDQKRERIKSERNEELKRTSNSVPEEKNRKLSDSVDKDKSSFSDNDQSSNSEDSEDMDVIFTSNDDVEDINESSSSEDSEDSDKTLTNIKNETEDENYTLRDSRETKIIEYRASEDVDKTLKPEKEDDDDDRLRYSKENEGIHKSLVPENTRKSNENDDNKPRNSVRKVSTNSKEEEDRSGTIVPVSMKKDDDEEKLKNSVQRKSKTSRASEDIGVTIPGYNQNDLNESTNSYENGNLDETVIPATVKKADDDDKRRHSKQRRSTKSEENNSIDKTLAPVNIKEEKEDVNDNLVDSIRRESNKSKGSIDYENNKSMSRQSERKGSVISQENGDMEEKVIFLIIKKDKEGDDDKPRSSLKRESIKSKRSKDLDKTQTPIAKKEENEDDDNNLRRSKQKRSTTSNENTNMEENVFPVVIKKEENDKPRNSIKRESIKSKRSEDIDKTQTPITKKEENEDDDNNLRRSKQKGSTTSKESTNTEENVIPVVIKKEIDDKPRSSMRRESVKFKGSEDIDELRPPITEKKENEDNDNNLRQSKQKGSITSKENKDLEENINSVKNVWALAYVRLEDDGAKLVQVLHTTPYEPGHYLFKEPNEIFLFGSDTNHKKSQ